MKIFSYFGVLTLIAAGVVFVAPAFAAEHCGKLSTVDINIAPQEDLVCIVHIGPSRTDQIIDLRADEPFASVEDMQRISGIGGPGSTTLEEIKSQGLATVSDGTTETEEGDAETDTTDDTQTTQEEGAQTEEDEVSTSCIDINTATEEELQGISGVGEVTAGRIIDARPFSSIDDLTQVKGIGDTTLAGIKEQGLACVDGVSATTPSGDASASFDPTLTLQIGADVVAGVGDSVVFDAADPTGVSRYTWHLGDGTVKAGESVTHAYQFPGTYVVTLEAESGGRSIIAHKRAYIFGGGVVISEIYVPAQGEGGWLELFNTSSSAVNLGGWSLRMSRPPAATDNSADSSAVFTIPKHTTIAPHTFLTLPATVTGLVPQTAAVVELFYPNGARADEIAFGALRPGQAIARLDTAFYWTGTPTPGGVNSVHSPPATMAYSNTLPYVEETEPPAGTSTIPAERAEVDERDPETAFAADILDTIDEERFSLPSLPISGAAAGAGGFALAVGIGYAVIRRRMG